MVVFFFFPMADLIDDNFVAGGGAPSAAAEKRKRKREKDKQKRDKKVLFLSFLSFFFGIPCSLPSLIPLFFPSENENVPS